MKKILFALMTMLLGTVLLAGNAMALPITGEISFSGNFSPIGGTGSNGLADATGVSFSNPQTVGDYPSGSFAGLGGSTADFTAFTFSTLPVEPLWAIPDFATETYSFDLTGVNIVLQNFNYLILSGTGILHASPFDDTLGTWTFSGDTAGGGSFCFSSGTAAIPDPAAVFLLGSACLIGFSGLRRKFKK